MATVVLAMVLLVAGLGGCAAAGPRPGQKMLFAPSIAWISGDTGSMVIQGRLFEPPESSDGRQAAISTLAALLHVDRHDKLFRERAGYLLSDSKSNTRVAVKLGDRTVPLGVSDPGGYVGAEVPLGRAEIVRLVESGALSFVSLAPVESLAFPGSARLVADTGVTVITDMDDTIKDTKVNDHHEKKLNTFVRPFRPVDGMPGLYRAWEKELGPRIHFHVVSAGPWQFHEPLRRFTEDADFPAFTWDMRSVDATNPGVAIEETLQLDPEKIQDFKIERIRAFMKRFTRRHVVLVGDSGERDPEVYARILAEFSDRVDAVLIRDVTSEAPTAPRYRSLFPTQDRAAKLRVFRVPADLPPISEIVGTP